MNNGLFYDIIINAKDKFIFSEVTPVKIDAARPKDKDRGRGRARGDSRQGRGDKGHIIQVHPTYY